jgi:hypothetical protein
MTIPTDPTKPITAEAQDLGIAIDTLKKRLDAIDNSKRIEYENLLDILIQRRRALTERLDAMPDTDPGSLPADITREVAELKRAVAQIADRLQRQ